MKAIRELYRIARLHRHAEIPVQKASSSAASYKHRQVAARSSAHNAGQ